jgi:hypothetical protein
MLYSYAFREPLSLDGSAPWVRPCVVIMVLMRCSIAVSAASTSLRPGAVASSLHNAHAFAFVVDVHGDHELFRRACCTRTGPREPTRVPSRWTPEELDLGDVALADLPRFTRTEGSVEPLTGRDRCPPVQRPVGTGQRWLCEPSRTSCSPGRRRDIAAERCRVPSGSTVTRSAQTRSREDSSPVPLQDDHPF